MPGKELYTDAELLVLLAKESSEQEAFTLLYNRFWETLFAIAYNRLKEVQVAEDIVHDVFCSIWHNRHSISPNNLKAYLAASVKYIVLAHLRRKEYFRKYQLENKLTSEEVPSPEDEPHYRQILNMMEEEINELPDACKLIFKCSRELGMSSKEIAAQFHISPKTVDNQINKALHRIRIRMKGILHYILF
jgi:RNA polymerase sigma-70 factor (family 1)